MFSPCSAKTRASDKDLLPVQYVLSSTPNNPGKSWSSNMRKNFVKGVQALINLIDKIQLADPQARQTGAHVEYESRNWYCVFNLDR